MKPCIKCRKPSGRGMLCPVCFGIENNRDNDQVLRPPEPGIEGKDALNEQRHADDEDRDAGGWIQ